MKTIFNDPVLYESAIKKVGEAYEKNKTYINLDLGEIHYKTYLNTLRNETGFGLYDTWALLSKYLKEQYKSLVIKDICSRLPYGVIGEVSTSIWNGSYDESGSPIEPEYYFKVQVLSINTEGVLQVKYLEYLRSEGDDTIRNFLNSDNKNTDEDWETIVNENNEECPWTALDFKPYLKSIGSITEDEMNELIDLDLGFYTEPSYDGCYIGKSFQYIPYLETYEWFDKNMYDIRNLIFRGLAIEIPKNKEYDNECNTEKSVSGGNSQGNQ